MRTGLVMSIVAAALAAWLAVGYMVEHKVQQRELGITHVPAHARHP